MSLFQKIAGILLSITILSGCEKDIRIPVPDFSPKLAIYGTITGDEDSIGVTVCKAQGILNYNRASDQSVTDARVLLLDNGQPAGTLIYSLGEYRSGILPQTGHLYMLKVTAPGFTDTAEASALLPEKITFTVERNENVRIDRNGDSVDELILRFDDPAASIDYYRVSFFNEYMGEKRALYSCIQATDPSIDKIAGDNDCNDAAGIYLKDELFNGSAKTLRLYIGHYDLEGRIDAAGNRQSAVVQLERLTPGYYRYLQGYYYMQQNDGNPFAEPVNVPANVKGGYGFFTITAAERYRIP